MNQINFNNKQFLLVENSENGKVNSETIFNYKQDGNIVTADYYGGTIQYGKIIAILKNDQLDMLYQCITTENELKAGKALANISVNNKGKIKLTLHWQWIDENNTKGISEYIEQ